jgi:hypothetical protein
MQEFFYTILAIWLIWRIFGAFSNSKKERASNSYSQTNNNYYHTPESGEVKMQQAPKKDQKKNPYDDDYVDYEEIK